MELIQQYTLLAGFAAIVAALVNVGKAFGLVKDGDASKWSLGLSTLGLIVFISLKMFRPELDVPGLDAVLTEASEIMLYALGIAVALGLPGLFHGLFKSSSVPLIGKSFSK